MVSNVGCWISPRSVVCFFVSANGVTFRSWCYVSFLSHVLMVPNVGVGISPRSSYCDVLASCLLLRTFVVLCCRYVRAWLKRTASDSRLV